MGTLRLYALPREVQKLIGGSGGILQPPRSVLRPYTVVKCKSLTANSRMMRLVIRFIHSGTAPFDFKLTV